MNVKKIFAILFNGAIVFTPLILVILPVDTFDSGESICLSKQLLGMECYACGMTRAIMHILHFDIMGAWAFNKLSFIVAPMLLPIWLKSLYIILGMKLPQVLEKVL